MLEKENDQAWYTFVHECRGVKSLTLYVMHTYMKTGQEKVVFTDHKSFAIIQIADNCIRLALLEGVVYRMIPAERESNLNNTQNINWKAIAEEKPKTTFGDFLICLENNTVHKAYYIATSGEKWIVVGVGEIPENNPVKYWAELPLPPRRNK